MRQATDLCYLCQRNLATQTNSHILPKFISTNFLEGSGIRRGYSLDSQNILKKNGDKISVGKTKTIQDSPKENYILCPECEAYFSVLEVLSRDTFIIWRDKVKSKEFDLSTVNPDLKILNCSSANPRIIRLLCYSIFWRASISAHPLFTEFKLDCAIEENLRVALLKYKSDRNTFIERIGLDPNFLDYPYTIITAEEFNTGDANFIMPIPSDQAKSSLIVDRFAFTLYNSQKDSNESQTGQYNNIHLNDCKMMILAEKVWKKVFNETPARILLNEAKKNL